MSALNGARTQNSLFLKDWSLIKYFRKPPYSLKIKIKVRQIRALFDIHVTCPIRTMSSITDLKLHITTVEHYHDISKAVFCRNFSDYIFALSKTHLYRQQPDFTVDLIQAIGRFLCIVLHIFIKEPSPPFSGKHFFASLASR